MGLGKKIRNKVNKIFGREALPTGRPLKNDVSPEELIAPRGQPPGIGARANRPDSPGDRDGRSVRTTRDRSTDNRVAPTALRSDGDRKYIDSVENVSEIQGINPINNRNRSEAASNDMDPEFLGPSGQPPMDSFEPIRIRDATNSGISIGGGTVNVKNIFQNIPSERIRPGLEVLQKRFAASAFHNSFQRIDPPRCHPDTRVAIQKQIYDWIRMDRRVRKAWIMWMHGAAGAGKSAIMQSIAELCEKAQIPLASFFFVRTDNTRNSMASFIATLVYQLIQNIPQIQGEIFGIIESNPRIFDQSLESQLQKLFIRPLLRVQHHFKGFFVVFIDGLDECIERERQSELIKLLATVCHSKIPVIFLLGSRREPQIEAEFVRETFHEILEILPLDNSDVEQTSEDIRHFVLDKFRDIKQTHLLKRHLPFDWPAASMVDEIVDKSSGQFIFASVVINYVSSPRTNPVHQLEIIRGIRLRDPSSQNPFAHLDAVYQHIFSQVEALGKVFDIIALGLLDSNYFDIPVIQQVFRLEASDLDVLFADLTAIILFDPYTNVESELKFLHASLPDFLLDKSRSEQYHIDLDEYREKLLCMLLERHPPISDSLWSADNLEHEIQREQYRLATILDLIRKENTTASENLRSAFMKFKSTFCNKTHLYDPWYTIGPYILQDLKQLNFSDQGEAYRHVMDVFAAEYARYWLSLKDYSKEQIKQESPDLAARINQILQPE